MEGPGSSWYAPVIAVFIAVVMAVGHGRGPTENVRLGKLFVYPDFVPRIPVGEIRRAVRRATRVPVV